MNLHIVDDFGNFIHFTDMSNQAFMQWVFTTHQIHDETFSEIKNDIEHTLKGMK